MPNWICPFCRAKMTVKTELLGQVRPCPKCKQESTIEDCDTIAPPLPVEALPESYSKLKSDKASATENASGDESIGNVARGMLLLVTAIFLLYGAIGEGNGQRNNGFPSACGVLFLAAILWPIYTMARDTRANRRLLEQIARSNER